MEELRVEAEWCRGRGIGHTEVEDEMVTGRP